MFPEEGLMVIQGHTEVWDYKEEARDERDRILWVPLSSLSSQEEEGEPLGDSGNHNIVYMPQHTHTHTHTRTHNHTFTHTIVSNATGQFYIYSTIKRMMCFTCNLLAWNSKLKIPLYECNIYYLGSLLCVWQLFYVISWDSFLEDLQPPSDKSGCL